MGWFGYGIYDGDETRTLHILFMRRAGYDRLIGDAVLGPGKTKLTDEMKNLLVKNINNVLNKMPKTKTYKHSKQISFETESDAIEWQMLLALFLDSNLKPPRIVKFNGILATEYLMGTHADEFDEPGKRKAKLRAFLKKATK